MDDLSGRLLRPSATPPTPRPRWGLQAHLLAVVLAVLLPALALGAATAWQVAQSHRRASEERLTDTARALALALDAEIGAHIAALRALAASPDLDPDGDLEAFRRLAEPALAGFGSWVVVSTVEDRRQLLNTALPPGAPLPPAREAVPAPLLEQAVATGQPTVLNLHRPPVMDRPSAAVVVPVTRDGAVIRLLGAPLLPERLSQVLAGQRVADSGFATLVDGTGRVVARSADHARFIGQRVPGWFDAPGGRAERGLVEGPSLVGQPAVIAFQRLGSAPSWTLTLGMPAEAHRAGWQAPLLWLATGGLAALGLALVLAAWLSQRILGPVRALVRRANALAAGGTGDGHAAPPVTIAEFEALRAAGERAEAALRRSTAELRESEARFRAVFDSDLMGLGVFDVAAGESVAINDRALRLMDATREEFESGLRDWAVATAPEHLARDLALCRQVAETGRGDPIEKDYIRKDGVRVPVRLSVAPLPGQPGRVVVAVEDQTEKRAAEEALRESESRFRALTDLAPNFIWFATPDGKLQYLNDRWYEFTGQTPEEALPDGWARALHPGDVARTAAAWAEARAAGTVYEIEVRYRRHDGEYRWFLARAEAVVDPSGRIGAWFGSSTDIHDRRLAEDRQALLLRELDHRAKNALAVVQAALRLTPMEDPRSYARAVEGRVMALARAHSMLAEARWQGAELRALLAGELSPFLAGQRAELAGPAVALPPAAAQSVAMAAHELATNATKHGALSAPAGSLSVAWEVMGTRGGPPRLRLVWRETGGPPLDGPPRRRGFGSRVLEATIRGQLGGSVSQDWGAAGLVCTLEIPLAAPPADGAWALAPSLAPG
jgi:PAS domain S-box-containing protein